VAIVIGASRSWREIVNNIQRWGHTIASPGDIERLLLDLRETREASIAAKRAETDLAVQQKAQQITALKSERRLIQRILNWFRVGALQSAIAGLHAAEAEYTRILDDKILMVESLRDSPELAGANGELTVIEQLRRLPGAYVVMNNVQLHATSHIRFNGALLRSAQIDHLVLSPAGVFIIETKNWSARFTQSGQYDNPYEQVRRAGHLCYCLLRKSFGKTRVRTIIVSLGNLPPSPEDSYAKVLRPEQINGYISWFKEVELSPERIDALRRYFEVCVQG